MKKLLASTLTVLLFATTAFAQTDDHAKAKKGAIIGGIAGAIAGGVISNNRNGHSGKRGAIVGGLAGTAAGAIVGAMMDKQERQLRQIQGVDVTRTADNELKVTVKNDVLFDYNSAGLRSASRSSLREMANVFDQYPNTTIAVEGFTDSTGSAAYNERLSERRAVVRRELPREPRRARLAPRHDRLRRVPARVRRTAPPAAASSTAASRFTSARTQRSHNDV